MDEPLHIIDCPLCRIFSHGEVKTKLYWPETKEEVAGSEFVIVDCSDCHVPLIVLGEHIEDITRECWGRILYRCRLIFGSNMRLRLHRRKIQDHWHAHLINKEY